MAKQISSINDTFQVKSQDSNHNYISVGNLYLPGKSLVGERVTLYYKVIKDTTPLAILNKNNKNNKMENKRILNRKIHQPIMKKEDKND